MITWHEHTAWDGTEEWPEHHAWRGDERLAVVSLDQVDRLWCACRCDTGKRLVKTHHLNVAKWRVVWEFEPCECVQRALAMNLDELPPCKRKDCPHRAKPRRRKAMARKPKPKPEEKPDNGAGQQKTERFQQTLRCELSREEVEKRADRAAHLVAEHEQKQADLDNAKKQAKAELDRIEAEHKSLSAQVRDRAEYRSVECEKTLDFRRWEVTVTRKDTDEVIQERPMSAAEREAAQTELALGDEQAANDADEAEGAEAE